MMNPFRRLLHKWFGVAPAGTFHSSRKQRAKRPTSFRPRLESLEDRLVLNSAWYYVVTDVGDNSSTSSTHPGNGTQAAPFQFGTLRSAILDANTVHPGTDTITFASSLFTNSVQTITLNLADATPAATKDPSDGLPYYRGPSDFVINTDITIIGPNTSGPNGEYGLTLDNNLAGTRLFYVDFGGSLTLENLTLTGGQANGPAGATPGGGGGAGMGGAIFNDGQLNLQSCTLSGNTATGGNGGGAVPYPGIPNPQNALGGGSTGTGFAPGAPNPGPNGGNGGGFFQGNTYVLVPGFGTIKIPHSTGGLGGQGGAYATYSVRYAPYGQPGTNGGFGGGGGGGGYGGGASDSLIFYPGGGGNGGNGGFGGGGGSGGEKGYGDHTYFNAISHNGVSPHDGYSAHGGYGGGSANATDGGGGGGAGMGGAIFNNGKGTVTITNCTLSENSAKGGSAPLSEEDPGRAASPGEGLGAAIFNVNGTLRINDSTISGNTAIAPSNGDPFVPATYTPETQTESGVFSLGYQGNQAHCYLFNSIADAQFAGNAFVEQANNLLNPSNPQLGPLANNGGPTSTMVPSPGSPAIDQGNSSFIPIDPSTGHPYATDQRGFARIYGSAVDIGAVETQVLNQTIAFGPLGDQTMGGPGISLSGLATASSGLPVSYSIVAGSQYVSLSGDTITLVAATPAGAVVTVEANQAGQANYYNPARPVRQSFHIVKQGQLINFGSVANQTYGDAPFTVSATDTSGLPVTFSIVPPNPFASISGNTVTILGATPPGTVVTVEATQAGNADFNAAPPVDQTFSIAQATPTVSVTDNGGAVSNSAYAATDASVTGVGGVNLANFGSNMLSYTYYAGFLSATQLAAATPLVGAPIDLGGYTVVAHYTSNNADYTNADSSPVHFLIAQEVAPIVTVGSATSVSGSGATLNGTVNPQGGTTTALFQYSTSSAFLPTIATTFASGFGFVEGDATDAAGDVFVADYDSSTILEILTNGATKTIGSGFIHPGAVAVDAAGDVFVADRAAIGNGAIKEILPNNTVLTLASGFGDPAGVAVDAAGNVFVADYGDHAVKEILASNSNIVNFGSGFIQPYGVTVDAAGDVFVADAGASAGNNAVVKILAGTDTPAPVGSGFTNAGGVAVDAAGDVFVADAGNHAVKEIPANNPTSVVTLSSGISFLGGVAVDPAGDVFVVDQGNNQITKLSPPTVVANPSAQTGTAPTAVSATLPLLSQTLYYDRVVATGPGGMVASATSSFLTVPPSTTTTVGAGPFTYNGSAQIGGSGTVTGAGGLSTSATSLTYSTNADGTGTTPDFIDAGTYYVTAHYVGDSDHQPSNGAAVAIVINQATSTTTTVGAGPFTYNGSAQIGGSGMVTGAGTVTGSATLHYSANSDGSGTADFVDPGIYYVTAHYAGDANHTASDGATVAIIINKVPTTTTTVGAGPFTYDGSDQIGGSGTVTGAGGLSTSATSLTYSANALGTVPADLIDAGTYYVTAHYAGDALYAASNGAPVAITILNPTSTAVTLSAAELVYGQSVTLTATVTGPGAPTGAVQFYDGTAPLGAPVTLASGVATYTTSTLTVGDHSISAVYSGDSLDFASTGLIPESLPVAPVVTSNTAYLPSNASSLIISGPSFDSNAANDSVSLDNGVTGTVISATSTSLTVSLSGLGSVAAGTALDASVAVDGVSSVVAQVATVVDPTVTAVTASVPEMVYGQSVTLTATVSGPSAPTGTVQFYDGSIALGSAVPLAGGVATYTTSSLPAGSLSISAVCSGDSLNFTSTGMLPEKLPVAPVVNANAAVLATNALSLIISGPSFDSNVANDSVSFDNGVTGTVVSATSTSLTVRLVGLGSVAAGTALDASAAVDGVSSSTVQVATIVNPTVTAVTTSVAEPVYGQSVTLTATVNGPGTPTGTVQFYDGSTALGSAVPLAGGVATYTTSSLPAGNDYISAVYSGDSLDSTSTGLLQDFATSSVVATPGLSLISPYGVAVDSQGDVFITEFNNPGIVEVNAAGTTSFIAIPSLAPLSRVAVDAQGDLFVTGTNGTNDQIVEVTAAGTASVVPTPGITLSGVSMAVDALGDLFIADTTNNRIVEVTAADTASVVPTPGISSLRLPSGVAVDAQGDLFITQDRPLAQFVEVNAAGTARVVPTPGLSFIGATSVAVDAQGDRFIADSSNHRIVEVNAAGTASVVPTPGITLSSAESVAVDAQGDLFIADSVNNQIVEVQASLPVAKADQAIGFTAPTSPVAFAANETVNLSASASSGDQVAFSIDPSSTGTGSISGNTLSVTGAGTFLIDANQAGDNNYNAASQVQQTLVVNPANTPPTVSLTGPTNAAFVRQTISLQATAAGTSLDHVEYFVDGVDEGAGTLSAGVWSFSFDTTTATDGSHTWSATAFDKAGNSTATTTRSFTVDNTPPTVSLTGPANAAFVRQTISLQATAADTNLDHVEFFVDSVDEGAGTLSAGVWSFSFDTTTATDGSHTWSATAFDKAGNSTATTTRSFTVDNTPPTLNLTSPANGAFVRQTISLQATAADTNLDHVEFFLDSVDQGAGTLSAGVWSFSFNTTTATDGSHTWSATAFDKSGNSTATTTRSFTVDNTPPTVSLTSPANAAFVRQTISLQATAADTNLDHVEFFVDGVDKGAGTLSSGVWSFSFDTTTATDGAHTWSATAFDKAGNSTATTTHSFTVDNMPPTLNLTGPVNGAFVRQSISLQATAADTNLDHVEFFLDTVDQGAGTLSAGVWSFSFNTTTATDGAHTWSATAFDKAGNSTATTPRSFTVDNTKPTVTISAPFTGLVNGKFTITFTVTYSDTNFDHSTLAVGNIILNKTNTAAATVNVDAGAGATRTVTLTNVSGTGTLGITLASGTAIDKVGNTAAAPSGPSATVAIQSPKLTSAKSAAFTAGTPMKFQLSATGAPSAFTFSLIGAPSWLSLNGSNQLVGTPPMVGTKPYNLTFTIKASNGVSPDDTQTPFTLTINPPLNFNQTTLPYGLVGKTYPTQTLTFNGGTGTVTTTLSIASNNTGLSITKSGNSVMVFGTPTYAGMASFTITFTDSAGARISLSFTLICPRTRHF